MTARNWIPVVTVAGALLLIFGPARRVEDAMPVAWGTAGIVTLLALVHLFRNRGEGG